VAETIEASTHGSRHYVADSMTLIRFDNFDVAIGEAKQFLWFC